MERDSWSLEVVIKIPSNSISLSIATSRRLLPTLATTSIRSPSLSTKYIDTLKNDSITIRTTYEGWYRGGTFD